MATLVNTLVETEEEESQYSPIEEAAEDATEEVTSEATPEEDTEDELPEKYRGKTVAELARMHEEAQQALGRQSSEVGELRKVFDDYIQNTVKTKPEAPTVEDEPVDFLLEPEKAVQRAIDNHPKLRQAEELIAQTARQQNIARLKSEFPDINETLSNPKFVEWVQASPVRQRLFKEADTSYDYDSAAELFSNWKDRNTAVERTKVVEKEEQKRAVRRVSTGNTRGNPDQRQTKKIYRRADIIKLMKEDPKRYSTLQDEIMTAYQEGRVK